MGMGMETISNNCNPWEPMPMSVPYNGFVYQLKGCISWGDYTLCIRSPILLNLKIFAILDKLNKLYYGQKRKGVDSDTQTMDELQTMKTVFLTSIFKHYHTSLFIQAIIRRPTEFNGCFVLSLYHFGKL